MADCWMDPAAHYFLQQAVFRYWLRFEGREVPLGDNVPCTDLEAQNHSQQRESTTRGIFYNLACEPRPNSGICAYQNWRWPYIHLGVLFEICFPMGF